MLYKYNELLESRKKLNPNIHKEFKKGDYVQLSPNINIFKLYKKIIDIYGDKSKSTLERIHKINIDTVLRLDYYDMKNVVVYPTDDFDLLFTLRREDIIPAEKYKINAIKYNL